MNLPGAGKLHVGPDAWKSKPLASCCTGHTRTSRWRIRLLVPQLDVITTTQPPDHWPILQANAMRATRTAAIHAAWVRFGRQIFELSPNLVSAFRLTDVTSSSFEGLHLPYRAFFLHFGLQADLALDDPGRVSPEFVNGAYIFQDAVGTIVIELTLSRGSEEASNLPGVQISIPPELANLGADEASPIRNNWPSSRSRPRGTLLSGIVARCFLTPSRTAMVPRSSPSPTGAAGTGETNVMVRNC